MSVTYTIPCHPNAPGIFCIIDTTETNTITNVPFNPTLLAAGDVDIQLVIQPAGAGQLLVTSQFDGNSSVQVFKPNNRLVLDEFPMPSRIGGNIALNPRDISRLIQPTAAP
jgi:hypothetical protein